MTRSDVTLALIFLRPYLSVEIGEGGGVIMMRLRSRNRKAQDGDDCGIQFSQRTRELGYPLLDVMETSAAILR
jgi:hypothetical protein